MKGLVILLLLANVALFGWYQLRPADDGASPVQYQTPEGIADIASLAEADGAKGRAVEFAPTKKSEAAPVTTARAEPAASQPVTLPATNAQRAGDRVVTEPRVVPEPGPDPALMPRERLCMEAGPFNSREELEPARAGLPSSTHIYQRNAGGAADPNQPWWVLSRKESDATRLAALGERFRQAGIGDIWVMSGGDRPGQVSLGVYATRANAQKRADAVSRLGFEIMVVPRYGGAEQWWLGFAAVAASFDSALLAPLEQVGQVYRVDCDQLAANYERI